MAKLVGPGLVMNQAINDSVAEKYKTKGSGMIPVYGDRGKRVEKWACTKCGEQTLDSHEDGPRNGVCQCPQCIGQSDLYRKNYSRIFGHD